MRLIIPLLFVFFCTSVYAQKSNFKSGYIIKSEGDTIAGFIDYGTKAFNSRNCYFKQRENSETEKFTVSDLNGYRFDEGKFFITKNIVINEKQISVFVEYLVDGNKNLFLYNDDDGDHFLLEMETGRIVELSNERVLVERNGHSYYKNTNQYIKYLMSAFSDAPSLSSDIAALKINQKDIVDLTVKYHYAVCSDTCIV